MQIYKIYTNMETITIIKTLISNLLYAFPITFIKYFIFKILESQ
jgi:hypothetical protein